MSRRYIVRLLISNFEKIWENCISANYLYTAHRLRLALKRADKVIAADQQSAKDVVKYYFVPKDKIVVK